MFSNLVIILSKDKEILRFMKKGKSLKMIIGEFKVLAKSFDEFCKNTDSLKLLPIVDEWLENTNPNTRRAVTESLRIWTNRSISKNSQKRQLKDYLSVGNVLRDISKKYPEHVENELSIWNLDNKKNKQVY